MEATLPPAPSSPGASPSSSTSVTSCSPPGLIPTAPGEFATSLAVTDDTIYWTAVESDGSGVVWSAPKCTGAPRTALARGRKSPTSIVVDAGRVAWIDDLGSVNSVAAGGGAVALVAEYPADAGIWSTVVSLGARDGQLYWTGVRRGCGGAADCPGYDPYVATAPTAGGAAVRDLFVGQPADAWSNLVVDASGVTIAQQPGEPPQAGPATLLRIPAAGGPPTVLDAAPPTGFYGTVIVECGGQICWCGEGLAEAGYAMSILRIEEGTSAQQVTLPAAERPLQRDFLTMDGDRVYFTEGNFDTYVPPPLLLRSMKSDGTDLRTLAEATSMQGWSAIAFDAQSVYVGASGGILVFAKP